MKQIKLNVAKLRKRDGLTQQQLAEALGVSFQTISKWETGISLPDIAMLPSIANHFQVSVDEVLGLKPLASDEYETRGTHKNSYWSEKLDYLMESRALMWNDDYLHFLIDHVWKITQPVNIVDFGCGYGYLGLKLLPLMPFGSTYTGIDSNEDLLREAKTLFEHFTFQSTFILCDVNSYTPCAKYDFAICQAFLRHMPDPLYALKQMVASVKEGGLVACIEVNRGIEHSGLAIKGFDCHEFEQTAYFQRIWNKELENEGRDYKIGMKVPFLMKYLGLKGIESRLNDKVNYLNPDNTPSYTTHLRAFLKTAGLEKPMSHQEKEKLAKQLMNRGLSLTEAHTFLEADERKYALIHGSASQAEIVHTFGLLITFGWR